MDDEPVVCCDAYIKLHAVKHLHPVLEAFKRVFRGRFPIQPLLLETPSVRPSSKVTTASTPNGLHLTEICPKA